MKIPDFQAEYTDITAPYPITESFTEELNALLEKLHAGELGKYQMVCNFCRAHSMDETLLWYYLFALDGKRVTTRRLKEVHRKSPPTPCKADSAELREKLLEALSSKPDPLIGYYFSGMLKLRHVFMDRVGFIFDKVLHAYLTRMMSTQDFGDQYQLSLTYFELLMDELGEEWNKLYEMVYTPPLELICGEYQRQQPASLPKGEKL